MRFVRPVNFCGSYERKIPRGYPLNTIEELSLDIVVGREPRRMAYADIYRLRRNAGYSYAEIGRLKGKTGTRMRGVCRDMDRRIDIRWVSRILAQRIYGSIAQW